MHKGFTIVALACTVAWIHSVASAQVTTIKGHDAMAAAVPLSDFTTGPTKITGKVVEPNGVPIAGAVVAVTFSGRYLHAKGVTGPSELQTDNAGRFTFVGPQAMKGIPQGYVVAYKTGFAPVVRSLQGEAPELVIKPAKGRRLSGLIRDKDERPLTGVAVSLEALLIKSEIPEENAILTSFSYGQSHEFPLPFHIGEPFTRLFRTQTDADGRWSLGDLPAAGKLYLQIEGAGFAHQRLAVNLGATPDEVAAITMQPAATVTGRVVFEDGKPASHTDVVAIAKNAERHSPVHTVTDAEGRFRLEAMAQETYTLSAKPVSLGSILLKSPQVSLTAGQTVEAPPLVFTRGGLVEGHVLEAKTGTPLAGVVIAHDKGFGAIETNAEGYYRMRLTPGTYHFHVAGKPDTPLLPAKGGDNDRNVVTIRLDQVETLNFTLPRGLSLKGVAVDEKNRPVVDVRILVWVRGRPSNFYPAGKAALAMTDSLGRWKVDGLTAGQYEIEIPDGRDIPAQWQVAGCGPVTLPHQGTLQIVLRKR